MCGIAGILNLDGTSALDLAIQGEHTRCINVLKRLGARSRGNEETIDVQGDTAKCSVFERCPIE